MSEELYLEKLGANIKSIRESKNISQIELAARCKFEKTNMSRLEAGRTNPTVLTLIKVSGALGVHIRDLFND
jgi:transcriptional regulator with XRE-family HTH domain